MRSTISVGAVTPPVMVHPSDSLGAKYADVRRLSYEAKAREADWGQNALQLGAAAVSGSGVRTGSTYVGVEAECYFGWVARQWVVKGVAHAHECRFQDSDTRGR